MMIGFLSRVTFTVFLIANGVSVSRAQTLPHNERTLPLPEDVASVESVIGAIFMRGINSFQLLNDGEKWLIVSFFWEAERPDNPIADKYLFD